MRLSSAILMALIASPATGFLQQPVRRASFNDIHLNRGRNLQAAEFLDAFNTIAEGGTTVSALTGENLVNLALLAVPAAALLAGSQAIAERNKIQKEVANTEKSLAETKLLLEKTATTISLSFGSAAVSFVIVAANLVNNLQPASTALPSTTVASTESSTVVKPAVKPAAVEPVAEKVKEVAKPKALEKRAEDVGKKITVVPTPVPEVQEPSFDALFQKLSSDVVAPKAEDVKKVTEETDKKTTAVPAPVVPEAQESSFDSLLRKFSGDVVPRAEEEVKKVDETSEKRTAPEPAVVEAAKINSEKSKVKEEKPEPKSSAIISESATAEDSDDNAMASEEKSEADKSKFSFAFPFKEKVDIDESTAESSTGVEQPAEKPKFNFGFPMVEKADIDESKVVEQPKLQTPPVVSADSEEVTEESATTSLAPAPGFNFNDLDPTSKTVLTGAGVIIAGVGIGAVLIASGGSSDESKSSKMTPKPPSPIYRPSKPAQAQPSKTKVAQPPPGPSYLNSLARSQAMLKSGKEAADSSYLSRLKRDSATMTRKGGSTSPGAYLDVLATKTPAPKLSGKSSLRSSYLDALPGVSLELSTSSPPVAPAASPVKENKVTSEVKPADPTVAATEPKPSAEPVPGPATTSYVEALSSGTVASQQAPKKSFSPMGKKPKVVAGTMGSSYLNALADGAPLTLDYSTPASVPSDPTPRYSPPVAPAPSPAVSSDGGASRKASFTPFQTSNPPSGAANPVGSYLDSLGASNPPTTSASWGNPTSDVNGSGFNSQPEARNPNGADVNVGISRSYSDLGGNLNKQKDNRGASTGSYLNSL